MQNTGRDTSYSRPVVNWILLGVVMLFIQVILGGVTRLTGSGLSITEWNVVTGTFPPLSNAQWLHEFEKYQQTPQYQLLNTHFTLSDFKFIFFWEWFHRLWARLIGVAFVVGFIYLVSKRLLKSEMWRPLIILFLLGALQGAVGWIMVASGLTGDAVYVKPTRLALHFIFALGLICYAFWVSLQLLIRKRETTDNKGLRNLNWALIGILVVQLIFGALMAGHKAALAAPTWPDINGSFIPPAIFNSRPLMLNFIENKITIHFVHRMLAYLLLVLIVIFTWKAYRTNDAFAFATFRKFRWAPLFLVCLQVLLGVISVIASPRIIPNRWGIFEWMAELHQITGMLLLLSLVLMAYLLQKKSITRF